MGVLLRQREDGPCVRRSKGRGDTVTQHHAPDTVQPCTQGKPTSGIFRKPGWRPYLRDDTSWVDGETLLKPPSNATRTGEQPSWGRDVAALRYQKVLR
jgi:hypothetical protein